MYHVSLCLNSLCLDCPGTQSDDAGKTSACQGCPNQTICSSGAPKQPDPGNGARKHKNVPTKWEGQCIPTPSDPPCSLYVHSSYAILPYRKQKTSYSSKFQTRWISQNVVIVSPSSIGQVNLNCSDLPPECACPELMGAEGYPFSPRSKCHHYPTISSASG